MFPVPEFANTHKINPEMTQSMTEAVCWSYGFRKGFKDQYDLLD